MILDALDNAERYFSLHSHFPLVLHFLKHNSEFSTDRVELNGERAFVLFSQPQGKKRTDAFLEAHRRYIDIHVCIEGREEIGWRALQRCNRIDKPYNDEKDFSTFADEPESWSVLTPNTFAIFFPEDAHAPMVSDGVVKKLVVKVMVE